MHLSRLQLKPEAVRSFALRYLHNTNGYALHQALWTLFPGVSRGERAFLYHLDEEASPTRVFLLSHKIPEDPQGAWSIESKPYAPDLHAQDRLTFLLRANPVRTRQGKRHDVLMEAKHRLREAGTPRAEWPEPALMMQESGEAWLAARGEAWGIEWLGIQAEGYRIRTFSKKSAAEPIRIATMDFSGLLRVTDPDRLRKALFSGVGSAKGFGCGLLMVRRA